MRTASLKVTIALLAATATGSAFGGTVKELNLKKKLVTVELAEGETVEKNAEICFFTPKGKKAGCGTVSRVKGSLAQVKITSKKVWKRIKVDMDARSGDAAAAAEGGEEVAADAKGGKKGAAAAAASKSKKQPFRIWGKYIGALATPSTYKKLAYKPAPSEGATTDTLWTQDGDVKGSLVGFGLEAGIPIGSASLNIGVRMRTFTPSVIDADYIEKRQNPYVSTEQKASALGVWFDYQYLHVPFTPSLGLNLTGGLDVDMSTVTLKAAKKDDSGAAGAGAGEVASATSKLTVIALRLGAGLDFMFVKMLGTSFGLNLLIPVSESGSFSGKVEPGDAHNIVDPEADLKTALGHKKNSAGIEITLGGVLAF